MEDLKFKYFIQDLVTLFKEKLEENHMESKSDLPQSKRDFVKGEVFAYYEMLDLIKSQCIAFDIPLDEFGLEDYNLESFL
ncbi:MAG: hypothetical protein WA004_10280 [Saprospiraceae bacterium]